MSIKSLYAFAKENGLPRSSVHAKAKSLGMDTSKGLSTDDQDALLAEFGKLPEASDPGAMTLSAPSSIIPDVVDPNEITAFDFGDGSDYRQYRQGVDLNSRHRIGALQGAAATYAQGRFAQVFAEIDMAAATTLANALNGVGVGLNGAKKEGVK